MIEPTVYYCQINSFDESEINKCISENLYEAGKKGYSRIDFRLFKTKSSTVIEFTGYKGAENEAP